MTAAADDFIANVTRAMDDAFPSDDLVLVISGDNGGIPMNAGSNCADVSSGEWSRHCCTLAVDHELRCRT